MEACWAHNPEVDGSKPSAATLFPLFFYPHIFKDSRAHSFLRHRVPLIAQLVERRTVVGFAEILRSLVRIRLEGQLFFFSRPFLTHSLSCKKLCPGWGSNSRPSDHSCHWFIMRLTRCRLRYRANYLVRLTCLPKSKFWTLPTTTWLGKKLLTK